MALYAATSGAMSLWPRAPLVCLRAVLEDQPRAIRVRLGESRRHVDRTVRVVRIEHVVLFDFLARRVDVLAIRDRADLCAEDIRRALLQVQREQWHRRVVRYADRPAAQ